jgi:hypothetical protein
MWREQDGQVAQTSAKSTYVKPKEDQMQSSVLSTGGGQALINPADTVILLLGHQTGLFQTVKTFQVYPDRPPAA